jgi:hypothetical protein
MNGSGVLDWLYLQKKHNKIRAVGGVPTMGAPMLKSVYDGEDNQVVLGVDK